MLISSLQLIVALYASTLYTIPKFVLNEVSGCCSASVWTILIVRVFLYRFVYPDVRFVAGWDVHCAGLVESKRREAEWKEKEQVWLSAPTNSTDDGWGVAEGDDRWVGSDELLFTMIYAMRRGTWPSVERGIEVTIDVHSVLEGLMDKECSACRCLHIRTDLFFQPDQPFILQHCRYFQWKLRIHWFPLWS
jgi:hypothetical protein